MSQTTNQRPSTGCSPHLPRNWSWSKVRLIVRELVHGLLVSVLEWLVYGLLVQSYKERRVNKQRKAEEEEEEEKEHKRDKGLKKMVS